MTTFAERYEQLCRRLRLSVLDLTEDEIHHLKDGADGRHPLVTVRRTCAIAARSYNDADRRGFADLVLAECDVAPTVADDTQADLFPIANEETRIEAHANVAVMDALVEVATSAKPCPKIITRAERHVDRHIHGLYGLKAALRRLIQ